MHAPAASPRSPLRVAISFITVTLIWGSTWLVIKTQLGVVPVSWSITWRFLLAGTIMAGVALVSGKRLWLSPRGHAFALAVGLMQFCLNFNFVYRAEVHLASGLVALTFALLVIPNAVLSALFLGTRITPGFAIGSGIGIAGLALVFARDLFAPGADGGEIGLGMALAIAGVLAAGVANVMQASATGRAQPLEAGLAWAMFYGTAINAGVAWATAGPPVFDASPTYIAGLAYLGIVASAVAFSVYYALIREIGAGKAAYSSVIVPLVAMSLSTAFEGYRWSALAVAGAGLALVGLVIALRSRG
ncbi:DMT family transporter [Polymorphobacter fuscus]|uniref:EamA family transporter n=1 Tax=Sandarakinorhabdus fusca TaxID=1439888 RepID=A0A7C9GVK5_9SPHN|nr:DMT family transporter [Polymorphobacter fuscus]KAB7646369.1 DMT family transporter [Polymorphobacter fuscus]MQT17598.1 EamA family transporter [Polymorphobacter fuscus]NJC09859.1 drug/metabolite transporter (DMT)-like permease [Polymorphobacter fuscus]